MLQEKLGHKSTGRLLIHWCSDWITADLRRSPLKVFKMPLLDYGKRPLDSVTVTLIMNINMTLSNKVKAPINEIERP